MALSKVKPKGLAQPTQQAIYTVTVAPLAESLDSAREQPEGGAAASPGPGLPPPAHGPNIPHNVSRF